MGEMLKIAQKRRSIILATSFDWDADFQNVMDYATTEGITMPSMAILKKSNNLLVAMKSAGIWSKLDVFVNFSYNDTSADEFSLIDWKRLSEMTIHGGMAYTVNGWEGNGIDGYVDTIFNPLGSFAYTLNNAARGGILHKQGGIIGDVLSVIDSAIDGAIQNKNTLYCYNTAAHRINTSSTLNATADLSGTGATFIIRKDSNNVMLIKKEQEINRIAVSDSIENNNQGLFKRGNVFSDVGLSNYLMGAGITYTEAQDFRMDYNTYLTAIGLSAIA